MHRLYIITFASSKLRWNFFRGRPLKEITNSSSCFATGMGIWTFICQISRFYDASWKQKIRLDKNLHAFENLRQGSNDNLSLFVGFLEFTNSIFSFLQFFLRFVKIYRLIIYRAFLFSRILYDVAFEFLHITAHYPRCCVLQCKDSQLKYNIKS